MLSVWRSFLWSPLDPWQKRYLVAALQWARSRAAGFEPHWELWRARLDSGRASVSPDLYRGGEGLFNAFTGGLYLSSARLPLRPEQCEWALNHWEHDVVLQGLVDVTAVMVHEASHALAGFWGSLRELGPYQQERDYLRQLARAERLRARAVNRLSDLIRDAWECEKIRLD